VLAARPGPRTRPAPVLLLEAGPAYEARRVPAGPARPRADRRVTKEHELGFPRERQAGRARLDRVIAAPRGKVLGGSSAVNGDGRPAGTACRLRGVDRTRPDRLGRGTRYCRLTGHLRPRRAATTAFHGRSGPAPRFTSGPTTSSPRRSGHSSMPRSSRATPTSTTPNAGPGHRGWRPFPVKRLRRPSGRTRGSLT